MQQGFRCKYYFGVIILIYFIFKVRVVLIEYVVKKEKEKLYI